MQAGWDAVFDILPDSVVLRSRSGRILSWNLASERLYGRSRAEAVGCDAVAIFGPDGDDPGAARALAETGAWSGECLRPGADGTRRVVELSWHLLPGGTAGEIVETGRDVTRARRTEEDLRRSEHRYRNMFQAMAASFWELDFFPAGKLLYAARKSGAIRDYASHFAENPGFVRELMRVTRVIDVNDQTVALFADGGSLDGLDNVEPVWPEASTPVFAASVVAAVTGAPHYSAETILRTRAGREFPALFTACFPPDTMNKGTLLIGVIDLSERVAAQTALARMQAEMAHAARVSMLGEMAASIAHEINQPLGAIAANGAAGMRWLARPEPDLDELGQLTARIVDDAQRAAEIIGRIRAMASGSAPTPGPVAVNAVLEDTARLLQHEIRHAGVRLTLGRCPAEPVVLADRVQLQQVVVNLALNALQAMAGAGTVAPALVIRAESADGVVTLTVEDTGPGIPADALPRLFDNFFTTREGGMGLGLAIARSIVTGAEGTITAGNRTSGGACFTVTLPRHAGGRDDHTKV